MLFVFLVLVPTTLAAGDATDISAPFSSIETATGIAMIVLSVLLLQNGEFLRHHYLQQLAVLPGARTQRDPFYASAWLRRFQDAAFSMPILRNLNLTSNIASRLILRVAMSLDLSHEFLRNLALFPPFPLILGPSYLECQVCGDALHSTRGALDIWILRDDGPHRAKMVQGNCRTCNTSHFPDRHHVRINGRISAFYQTDAEYLRIGGKVWASRDLAITQTSLRHDMQASTESIVTFYNERYCRNTDFRFTRRHAWRLFVLHESLEMCRSRDAQLVHPSFRNLTGLCEAMREEYFAGDVKVIHGAKDHGCDECVGYMR